MGKHISRGDTVGVGGGFVGRVSSVRRDGRGRTARVVIPPRGTREGRTLSVPVSGLTRRTRGSK